MSIYSDQLQQLTDQLVTQNGQLQQAVASSPVDLTAASTAANAIEQTANSIDQCIKSADIPADNTMVLAISTDLLYQVTGLQQALASSPPDDAAVVAAASNVDTTTVNLSNCVSKMKEVLAPAVPLAPGSWFPPYIP
jgi:hypothetical protein